MTRDDIIRMAREAEWTGIYSQWVSPTEREHLTVPVTMEQIERFAQLVAEAEREACAKVCEDKGLVWKSRHDINPETAEKAYMASQFIASEIRARGQQ